MKQKKSIADKVMERLAQGKPATFGNDTALRQIFREYRNKQMHGK